MNFQRLSWKGILHYRATGLLICIGIVIASATLTGSLVVGDSVRGSLQDTVLGRLGNIDVAIFSTNLVPVSLMNHLNASSKFRQSYSHVVPVLQSIGNAVNLNTNQALPHINLIGIKPDFPLAYPSFRAPIPHERDVVVNETVANALDLHVGDALMIHIPSMSAVPTDSLFGRRSKEDATRSLRVVVSAILPGNEGDFSLTASTGPTEDMYISREWLRMLIGENEDCANLFLLVKSPSGGDNDARAVKSALERYAQLSDFGLNIAGNTAHRYLNLQTDSIVMDNKVVQAAQETARDCGAYSTLSSIYLATQVSDTQNRKTLHYLVVAGVGDGLGISCPDNEILLNSWAYKRLLPKPGVTLNVRYLAPDWMGTYQLRSLSLRYSGLTDNTGEGYDNGLVPTVPGITDEESIANWNPPFPINLGVVTPDDEAYWHDYRAAPKAFASLDTVKSMWLEGSMDSMKQWVTGVLVMPRPIQGIVKQSPFTVQEMHTLKEKYTPALLHRLVEDNAGLSVLPVRQLALKAANGSTDFGGLFLGLGFFLVIASLLFSGVLMRLSAERRVSEAGTLLSLGFSPAESIRAIKLEGAMLSLFGALAGTGAGVAYAAFTLHLLSSKWSGAIGDTHLNLHLMFSSLFLGFSLSFVIALLSMFFSLRRLTKIPALKLLRGETEEIHVAKKVTFAEKAIQTVVLVLVVALYLSCTLFKVVSGEESFFAIGALLLVALLNGVRILLKRQYDRTIAGSNLLRLALRNLSAGLLPAMVAIGLIAGGVFVLIAVAANVRVYHQVGLLSKTSGTGGYSLIVKTTLPVNSGKTLLGKGESANPQDASLLRQCRIMSFLESPGDDISCLNLAVPEHPRLLGVSPAFINAGGFDISANSSSPNPWNLLDTAPKDNIIPAFADSDSVEWILHSGLGQTYEITLPNGEKQKIRFEGLLEHSVFASEILISERNFRMLFPEVSYPRYFLVQTPPGVQDQVSKALQRDLADYGVQIQTSRDFLNSIITVQNTYISAFLALGGIGLLLGAAGLIAALLLNAWRRRKEFAMMLAIGFDKRDVITLLLLEYGGILAFGLMIGAVTALIASYPEIISTDARINWQIILITLASFLVAGILPCLFAGKHIASQNIPVTLKEE